LVRITAARWQNGASVSGHAWHEIQPMGFDLRFKRLWEFYMYYCEAGFRSGHINVRQVVYS
jgi:cyclopropane-fatty-acyl-phospholipid synthase